MVKMVSTLLKGRKARIIMDGCYSADIRIDRGTPQGDRSSPYLFIIVMEILLIKVRGMEGKGIDGVGGLREILQRIDGLDI